MKHFFALLFVCTIQLSLFAQEYQPMALEGATWVYQKAGYFDPGFFGYSIQGDTVIEGESYKLLYKLKFFDELEFLEFEIDLDAQVAAIRDDSLDRKVYVRVFDELPEVACRESFDFSGEETLLYDFSLGVGDTTVICDETVRELKSYQGFGYEVNGYKTYQTIGIYERFGDNDGIFGFNYASITASGWVEFKGYCIGDFEDCQDAIGPLSTKEVIDTDDIKVSPNPAKDYINISYQTGVISNIKLFSVDGALVRELDGLDQESVNVDLQGWTIRGLMIALITDGEGRQYRKKVLVQ